MTPNETALANAIAGANHIAAYEPARSVRALRATSPEVIHSSKYRRVLNSRQSVWPNAVRLRKASVGRTAKRRPSWPSVGFSDVMLARIRLGDGRVSELT